MKSFFLGLQFLTIFRIPKTLNNQPQNFSASLRWFFLVGLLIGLIQWGLCRIALEYHIPVNILAFLIVIVGIVITGGLHLDGAADTADGFGAGHNRESVLRIMKDNRTGVYGIAAVVLAIYGKILSLNYVFELEALPVILIAPMISRSLLATTCTVMPYAREDGTAKAFSGGTFFRHSLVSLLFTAIISFYWLRVEGLILFGIAILAAALFCLMCFMKIMGFTGDTLGAQNEITEIVMLFAGGFIL